jgi:integrase
MHFREAPISGHVLRRKRKSGDRWMAKWREAEGQHQIVLGKAWTKRGRPADGFLTKQGAQRELDAILADARRSHLTSRPRRSSLRHSFGTLAVQVFPLTDVKAYMGHADIATTMIYVHHVPQVDAAEKLSTALRDASTAASASVVAA